MNKFRAFAVTEAAGLAEHRAKRDLGKDAVVPFEIELETAARAETVDLAGGPGFRKGGQKIEDAQGVVLRRERVAL